MGVAARADDGRRSEWEGARCRGLTSRACAWERGFLAALERCASVADAARAVGISRQAAYAHRARCPEFAAAWGEVVAEALDGLEARAFERAMATDPKADPQSASLLMFVLRTRRRELYGDHPPQPTVNVALSFDAVVAALAQAQRPEGAERG